ncbi:MAG TPA: hydroxyacid dehydrogenase [Trebonia sp.]|nr:hydroxyacid dehydrogenase [Trebonia sp.]
MRFPESHSLTAALAMRADLPRRLFGPAELERMRAVADLDEQLTISDFKQADARLLAAVDVLITGWGCPPIGAAELAAMPRLRAIIHAGGTVKNHLGPPAWSRGILVTTAADANAYPVAEYTLAAILLAGKGVPELARAYSADPGFDPASRPDIGNYQRTVGIIGASRVGRRVIELLGAFDFTLLLSDPHLADDDPILARARRVSLAELFRRASIVSIHAPLLPETAGMVGQRQLDLMSPGSVLINTARGAIVDHDALVRAVRDKGVRAILDVTAPEPLPAGHPLRTLPGVILTPHVAGSLGNELRRLGESAVCELELLAAGRPPSSPVRHESQATMA